jgi:DNA mismatch endonuclease (patch repair protein)
VFPRARVAVFVDGCFWHRCPAHGISPATHAGYWSAKLDRNVERDAETNAALRDRGWAVVRIWEHEDPNVVADAVGQLVASRR